jgi:diamine N-acetyltransferase
MSPNNPDNQSQVLLRPVDRENWRDVAGIQVTQSQREFVAEPSYYLALCCYGNDWQPLAITLGERVIGFMMWAVDPADNSCWLGGIMIDQSCQGKGYGRQAVQEAIEMLAKEYGYEDFALSYQPKNLIAKHLYNSLGFSETDEWDEDEIIARLSFAG